VEKLRSQYFGGHNLGIPGKPRVCRLATPDNESNFAESNNTKWFCLRQLRYARGASAETWSLVHIHCKKIGQFARAWEHSRYPPPRTPVGALILLSAASRSSHGITEGETPSPSARSAAQSLISNSNSRLYLIRNYYNWFTVMSRGCRHGLWKTYSYRKGSS
jgi:hypothetical protein